MPAQRLPTTNLWCDDMTDNKQKEFYSVVEAIVRFIEKSDIKNIERDDLVEDN